jgi:hypothetical protein
MNTTLEPKSVERNVLQDYFRDGLMELSVGAYLLFTGILMQAEMSSMFILVIVFAPLLVKRAKERFTYPRVGYVKFTEAGRSTGQKILVMLVGVVVAFALMLFFSRGGDKAQVLYRWMPLLPALLFQAALIPIGMKSGLVRYYVLAGLALAVGLAIPLIDLPGKLDSIALYLMSTGPIFLIWGMVIFANFLQTYPVRAEEEPQ